MNILEAVDYAREIREDYARPCPLCAHAPTEPSSLFTRIGLLEHLKRRHIKEAA